MNPVIRQVSLHCDPLELPEGEHRLAIKVATADGSTYMPRLTGGVQPWVRMERVRVLPVRPLISQGADVFASLGRGKPGTALLHGLWARQDEDGSWALSPEGVLILPAAAGGMVLGLEILAHPACAPVDLVIAATGHGGSSVTVRGVGSQAPELCSLPLPPSRGNDPLSVSLVPLSPSSPTREFVKVRAVALSPAMRGEGAVLALSASSPDTALLSRANGWVHPQANGVWTSQGSASLTIAASADLEAGVAIQVVAQALDPSRQKIAIGVNDSELRARRFRRSKAPLRVTLPSAVTYGDLIEVKVVCDPILRSADGGEPVGCLVSSVALGRAAEREQNA